MATTELLLPRSCPHRVLSPRADADTALHVDARLHTVFCQKLYCHPIHPSVGKRVEGKWYDRIDTYIHTRYKVAQVKMVFYLSIARVCLARVGRLRGRLGPWALAYVASGVAPRPSTVDASRDRRDPMRDPLSRPSWSRSLSSLCALCVRGSCERDFEIRRDFYFRIRVYIAVVILYRLTTVQYGLTTTVQSTVQNRCIHMAIWVRWP